MKTMFFETYEFNIVPVVKSFSNIALLQIIFFKVMLVFLSM